MDKVRFSCTSGFRRRPTKVILAASIAAFAAVGVPQSRAVDAIFSSVSLGGGDQDAAVGLNSSEIYHSNVNVGGGALTIEGVDFEGTGGGSSISGTNWLLNNAPAGPFTGFASGVDGQIGSLLSDFVYNGNPATLTLDGLTVGQTYILTSYNGQFGGAGGRVTTVSSLSGSSTVYDQNTAPGLTLLRYTFTASATTEDISFLPLDPANTWHFYGFSNEQVFSNAWSAGSNWTTATWGAAGVPNRVGANADFAAQGSPTTITLDANQTVGHLRFAGNNPWTLAGSSTLTLQADAGGVSVLSTVAGRHTISAPVSFGSDVIKSGAGTLVFAGAIAGNDMNVTLGEGTLEFASSGSQTLNASITGSGALTKSGTGTLILTGLLNYTGATTIGAGGILNLAPTSATALSSVIGGGGSLTMSGTAPLVLASTNTYSGGTTISAGTLTSSAANATGTGTVTVATGAKWELGDQSHSIAGLIGGGNVGRSSSLSTGDDGASLISSTKNYVQKLDFGNADAATVNDVVFDSVTTSGPDFTLETALSTFSEVPSTGYDQLISDFQFGEGAPNSRTPSQLTITGLTSGSLYDLTLYTQIGVWGARPQNSTFSSGGNVQMLEFDPQNVGFISFKFVADGPTATVRMAPQNYNASFHYFGATVETITDLGLEVKPLTLGDAGNYNFSGVISGPIALVKQGSGTQTLSGVNTYTGLTTVSAGTLLINGSISGGVNVENGATLGGSGGAMGAVSVAGGGMVAPGEAVGTLNTGAFSLASTSVLKFELAAPGVVGAGSNDLLSVTGALTLDGVLKVTELPNFGEGTYRLINYTGTLTNNTLDLEVGFLAAHPGSFIDATSSANQVNLVVVPEPGTAVALLGGSCLLLGLRRRRR